MEGISPFENLPLESKYNSNVGWQTSFVIAGDAGKRIGTAAAAFSRGAILAGLWATQRNDYPVTVRSGYSTSEVTISPEEILFTGVSHPNIMVVLFPAGLEKVRTRLLELTKEDVLFINAELLPVDTDAEVVSLDFRKTSLKREYWALMAMAKIVDELEIYPLDALRIAVESKTKLLPSQNAITALNNFEKIIISR